MPQEDALWICCSKNKSSLNLATWERWGMGRLSVFITCQAMNITLIGEITMNFDEFKDIYFAGDAAKALEQLAKESYTREYTVCKTANGLQAVLDSMDKKTASDFIDSLYDEIEKNPKPLKYARKIAMLSGHIGIGLDEVIKVKKNPFVRKFIFNILTILSGILIFTALLLLKKALKIESDVYSHILNIVLLLFISSRSPAAASNLMNIFRFNKLKKLISNDKEFGVSECSSVIEVNDSPKDLERTTEDKTTDLPDLQERELITRTYIIKFLRAYYRNQRNASLATGIVMAVLFGGLSFVSGIQYVAIPAFIASFSGFLFIHINARIKLRKTESLDFYISVDKCVNKEVTIDQEDNSVSGRYLFFEGHGKHRIDYQHAGMFVNALIEGEIYDSVNIGENCYIVLFESDKKTHMALPEKRFCFDAEEFELDNGRYYPIKDADTNTLINNEIQAQQGQLSDRQIKAINEANKSINNAKSKNRALVVCSVIGIFLTILGAFIDVVCVLNLFIQPLLFTIPIVASFIAARKAKKALDKVSSYYVAYSELHHMQSSVAGKTLAFWALDIFACLFNFFFIVLIHKNLFWIF